MQRQLVEEMLRIISLSAFTLCILFGWMFYEFYFKWRPVFEEGRYFDPESGVVYHDSGIVFGALSFAALLISTVLWLIAGKIRDQ